MVVVMDPYVQAADDLRRACAQANSEMTVATRFEAALVPLLAAHGVTYAPQREQRVVATRRRIDSQFGAVITEYKEHMRGELDWEAATTQLIGYVEELAPDPAMRDPYVGVVTDGRQLRFITFEGGQARAEHPGPLDGMRLRRYVETLVALGRRGLTPSHLVEDFATVGAADYAHGGPAGLGRRLAQACYEALGKATTKTGMLQSEWQRIFAQSVDHHEIPPAHAEAFREALELPESAAVDAPRALFALQSAYAIVVKLVAARVLSELKVGLAVLHFDRWAAAAGEELRRSMEQLEDGYLLREYGLENLLEGDFFAWYVAPAQWTPALASAIRDVIQRLADYEGRAPLLRPGTLGDMFRLLYQRTIPAVIRHDLGEYYTPRWLAQSVLADLPAPPGWRGLDPCCGSGTFVVEMIAEVLLETDHLPHEKRLAQVLKRVHGIDLNPLAVLTARVNYFLSIAHLMGEHGAIEIPVYLGDAACIPTAIDLDGVSALSYTLPTAMGPLDVALPLNLAKKGASFGAVMREVERAVIALDAPSAAHALRKGVGAEAAVPAVAEAIAHFVDALVALEKQDWNRIWARLVKNFLATAAIGPFERVVGNPPWVEWKDLPDGYRQTINAICRARGLFSDDGYAGGTDLNICVLIAHTALERWVVPGGYLSFLMPHQLLQVRSTQGFRRWKLPDGTPLALRALADWTALRPFEAACQPVTYLIQRGVPGPELVPMRIHQAASRAPRPADAAWKAVRGAVAVLDHGACQVDADGGPYLIDEPEVLPEMLAWMGECPYRGRRATETSPHGVFWVRPVEGAAPPSQALALIENALNPRSRDRIARATALVERELLYPMLRGQGIQPFRATPDPALLLFPHEAADAPDPRAIATMPPRALDYMRRYQDVLEARSSYKEYRSKGPFYSLWRVGPYTFAPYKVVWPEMGELRAAVVSSAATPWGEDKMLVPEGKVNLVGLEREDEAHYLCALLNTPLIKRAYQRMSSQIGRPSRLPFALPTYDETRFTHRALAAVSRAAHGKPEHGDRTAKVLDWLLRRLKR